MKMRILLHLLVFCVFTLCKGQDDETYETVSVALQLEDYDLTDAYDDVAEATKYALLGYSYKNKSLIEKHYSKIIRQQSVTNSKFEDVPYELQRNWTLLTNVGNFLLSQDDYDKLIDFHNANEELSNEAKLPCIEQPDNASNLTCYISKQDYLDIIATNRNMSYLERSWEERQKVFNHTVDMFYSTLQLTNKAYIPNGQHNARSYWEMLSEYSDGYSKAQSLWEEVKPLYEKLHSFVKIRLEKYYNITENSTTIPVYLLGTNFGNDWSNVAEIILPHPYLFNEALTELSYQKVESIYKLAENSIQSMGLKGFGKQFWIKSNFSYSTCGPHIFTYCNKHFSEILTCQKLGWKEYLDIHETSINIALRHQDLSSFPRRALRFSAVDDAFENLGSIIGIDNLPMYNLISKNASFSEKDAFNYKNTALLLKALRTLPKLPYYLLTDLWRLDELEFSYGNLTDTWWQYRNDMQFIQGNKNLETDYLGDSYITSNKPYLSKFLGVFLQFQLLDYYEKYFTNENSTTASTIGRDENFISFINDRPNKNWMDLISYYNGIDDISSTALLEYFRPLETYLEEASLEQVKISTTAKPTTIKTTTKPKSIEKVSNRSVATKETYHKTHNDLIVSNARHVNDKMSVNHTTETLKTDISLSANKYVFIGIGSFILVAFIIVVIVMKLKRKQKTTNRRFET